jgi:hypothetical protein
MVKVNFSTHIITTPSKHVECAAAKLNAFQTLSPEDKRGQLHVPVTITSCGKSYGKLRLKSCFRDDKRFFP